MLEININMCRSSSVFSVNDVFPPLAEIHTPNSIKCCVFYAQCPHIGMKLHLNYLEYEVQKLLF